MEEEGARLPDDSMIQEVLEMCARLKDVALRSDLDSSSGSFYMSCSKMLMLTMATAVAAYELYHRERKFADDLEADATRLYDILIFNNPELIKTIKLDSVDRFRRLRDDMIGLEELPFFKPQGDD